MTCRMIVAAACLAAIFPGAGEEVIPQGSCVSPSGDRLEVTSLCLRLNGKAIVPVAGEMHFSRIPAEEWGASLDTVKAGGVSIVTTYVFWNHHEWKEGEYRFDGCRDISAFLSEVRKRGLWCILRIGPWPHGEAREGGFPDWLIDKSAGWAGGDAAQGMKALRTCDERYLGEVRKFWMRLFREVGPHLWKNGGSVIGVQLENESRGPWPYYMALKSLAVEIGYDVPLYSRTMWPALEGGEGTFGEMIPFTGGYADAFWERSSEFPPKSHLKTFTMKPLRTSATIATDHFGQRKAEDEKDARRYPYFSCELGGGMISSYHRRIVMEPEDAFSLAVVRLGSGANLLGFYMYHGGTNPTDEGTFQAESQRDRYTKWNDLPRVSYEYQSPVSEFGEPQLAYWLIRDVARFCREHGAAFAAEQPVFLSEHETRRGRYVFHNEYLRRVNPDGDCWIGIVRGDGTVERLVDRKSAGRRDDAAGRRIVRYGISDLKLVKAGGKAPDVVRSSRNAAMIPDESVWDDAAAEYEVPLRERGDVMLEIRYEGDMARLYADGKVVQDDFSNGKPLRYALRRLPPETKRLTFKVLPWAANAKGLIFRDEPPVPCVSSSRADRLVRVDADGVMRWRDDGSEVALLGVNYHLPFYVEYAAINGGKMDFSEVMREDIAHFRRLGIGYVRLHCFDCQFSTRNGGFVANRHVELLDELIDLCASNGIYTVLTPIAWWNTTGDGFSNRYTMEEMTTDPKARAAQVRFLKEFGEHVNSRTGARYADDPAILCFELINEPHYPQGLPDAKVTEYIDAIADGLRASGTAKPVFYNSWIGRNAAAGRARIDGVTGSCYATGLASGHALKGLQLAKVRGSSLMPDVHIARKARMIYEFDCSDTPGAYMYPAFARLFRHEGVQLAAQFQYDAMRLAGVNDTWNTHYLNLVYTPAKALSYAIAAEAFRRLPRGCAYASDAEELVFPPFRVNAARNLSQMATDTDYLYTADPLDPPPAPEKLRRVWGVGRSSVVSSSGNGIYFLDKAMDGVWRLQLYPSAFTVRDEYSGGKRPKVVLLPEPATLKVSLAGLGEAYRVRAAADGTVVKTASSGYVTLAAGDYVLENVADFGPAEKDALVALDTPEFRAPKSEAEISALRVEDVPGRWRKGRPMPFSLSVVGATNIVVTVQSAHGSDTRSFPEKLLDDPDEWNFLDVEQALRGTMQQSASGVKRYRAKDRQGEAAFGISAKAGAFSGDRKVASLRVPTGLAEFRNLFGDAGRGETIIFRARATSPFTKRAEIVFIYEDGGCWGTNLPLTEEWRDVRVHVKDLGPYWRTRRGDGTAPDMSKIRSISLAFGRWLVEGALDKPHGFEISSICVEFSRAVNF